MKSRQQAVVALESIESGRPWIRSGSDDRDERFVDELVTGVIRWKNLLDHLVEVLSERKIGRVDARVRRILETGLYQLWFMRVPSHAAVSESVTLAGRVTPRARGFVNAILRRASKQSLEEMMPKGDSIDSIALRTGHPSWLLERWSRRFGRERALRIAEANQRHSHPDLVVNRSLTTFEEVAEELDRREIDWRRSTLVDGMIRLDGGTSRIADLIEKGLVWPMDEGSVIVAGLARHVEGSRIFDVAAAPGGKSFWLSMKGHRVVSGDGDFVRLALMRRRQARVIPDRPFTGFVGDGRMPPVSASFATVLLDAPCSATGIIRKYPEIKWRLTPDSFSRLAAIQTEMLASTCEMGERVVYATCSIEPEENDEVIRRVLDRNSGLRLGDVSERVPEGARQWVDRGVLKLTPEADTDGFSAFMLERK